MIEYGALLAWLVGIAQVARFAFDILRGDDV